MQSPMRGRASLAEEAMLLLYHGGVRPDGRRRDDVFSAGGGSGRLVAGALLMDLALRGRVRMERPLPPERRGRRTGVAWRLGVFLVLASTLFVPVAAWRHLLPFEVGVDLPPAAWTLLPFAVFLLFFVVVMVFGIASNALAPRMVIADASPMSEDMLDATLRGLLLFGPRGQVYRYIRRYFDITTLPKILDVLRARLEWRGLLLPAASGRQATLFGLVPLRTVDRAHPAFRSIGDRIRRQLLGGEVPDAGVVALAVLFGREPRVIMLGRPGERSLYGLPQFFTREELPTARHRLRAIAAGDPTITAHLGGELYDTLIAIRIGVQEARASDSSSAG